MGGIYNGGLAYIVSIESEERDSALWAEICSRRGS